MLFNKLINLPYVTQLWYLLQWSAVTVTPSGIGKIVTITDCHSNSVTLILLSELGIAKTVTVADCHSNRCHSNRRPL